MSVDMKYNNLGTFPEPFFAKHYHSEILPDTNNTL